MQLSSGTTGREYVSNTGTIFGVALKRPIIPELRQILSQYFSALSDPTTVEHSHAAMHVALADQVISSGHMRAFAGRAFPTSSLLQGAAAGDIQ